MSNKKTLIWVLIAIGLFGYAFIKMPKLKGTVKAGPLDKGEYLPDAPDLTQD